MSDPIYLIVNAIPNSNNMEEVQNYLSKIVPLFNTNGGEKIERYKTIKQLMGNSGIVMFGVFQFPSIDVIEKMMLGTAFNSLTELRSKAFKQLDLMVCETF
ncbi:MAG: DUF1330 domain-containing protein [Flavobacteriaceae bacterium]